MDVLSAWRHRGARVRYLYRTDSEHSADEFYVCLDGKFHSWLVHKPNNDNYYDWVVWIVKEPDIRIRVPAPGDWFDQISGEG